MTSSARERCKPLNPPPAFLPSKCIYSPPASFPHSLSLTASFVHCLSHSHTPSLIHSLPPSSLTRSLIPSLIASLSHSLPHSFPLYSLIFGLELAGPCLKSGKLLHKTSVRMADTIGLQEQQGISRCLFHPYHCHCWLSYFSL